MIEKQITIINKLGLHARAATKLAQCCNRFDCSVSIIKGEMEIDAKSIMAIMLLAAGQGSKLLFKVVGGEELQAMEAIEVLINDYFGEGE